MTEELVEEQHGSQSSAVSIQILLVRGLVTESEGLELGRSGQVVPVGTVGRQVRI